CLDAGQNIPLSDLDDLRVLDGLGRVVKVNFSGEKCLEVHSEYECLYLITWQGRSQPILLTAP
ncbi:MAG: hypothetical protein VXX44_06175, partial [Bacteroidota bacterium]|nr:hypothetical protein [Bacteroidota bacterium]